MKKFLEKIYALYGTTSCAWKEGDSFCIPENSAFSKLLAEGSALREKIETLTQEKRRAFLFIEEKSIYFLILQCEGWTIVLGPMSQNVILKEHLADYLHRHHIKKDLPIPHIEIHMATKLADLITYHLTGEDLPQRNLKVLSANDAVNTWLAEAEEEEYLIEQADTERGHDSAAYEEKMLRIVREGDVDGMMALVGQSGVDEHNVGVVSENELKQQEYLVVTLITLLSRAAVAGGVSQEKSFSLADLYLQKLSTCMAIDDMNIIGMKAELEYVKLVREAKEAKTGNPFVEDCKNYIAKNLRKPFKVADVALAVGANRSYLATLFAESEGITMQKYIMRERCRHAANLLKYTRYPISMIAEYFCFSSQSHFGKQFKEFYGMSPKEYRNENHVLD